jgi:hypothetical protein
MSSGRWGKINSFPTSHFPSKRSQNIIASVGSSKPRTLRLERYAAQRIVSTNDLCGRPNHLLECQMSKRKPATASKHALSPKAAAKAQRATQAIVRRSPKDSRLRLVAAGSTESPPERHNDSRQEAPLVENPATALQDDCKRTITDNDSKKGFEFSSATANVRAYQAKLLEMAQADMQFAFEFAQRLATIRSPVEFPRVIAEFTSKRIAMSMEVFKRNG